MPGDGAAALGETDPQAKPTGGLSGVLQTVESWLESIDPAESDRRRLAAKAVVLHLLIFVVSVALIVSRRPDLLLRAQFWAEGGHTWYVDAYNQGLGSLLNPCGGSLDTFPRLFALPAQALPLRAVPTVFNLTAAAFHALNVNLLFSRRLRDVFPRSWMKWVIAAVLIGLPGGTEVLADISNVHNSHLPLTAALLLLLATPPRTAFRRVCDAILAIVFSLSGPFCEAMAPLLFVRWLLFPRFESATDRSPMDRRWIFALFAVTAVCAALQVVMVSVLAPMLSAKYEQPGSVMMWNSAYNMTRHRGVTGASLPLFVGIFGGKIVFATLFGDIRWFQIVHQPGGPPLGFKIALALTLLSLPVLVRSLRLTNAAQRRLTLFLVFIAAVFAGTLAFPLSARVPNWILWIFDLASGNRYWFLPAAGYIIAVVCVAACERIRFVRWLAVALLCCLPIGLVSEWATPPLPDAGFSAAAQAFDAAPAGTKVLIPSQPSPESGAWAFYLTKR